MKILALETTERTGSVALADGERIVAQAELDPHRRSAQTLAPAIGDLLEKSGSRPSDIELVALAIGPGSFTGLRVGIATAKAFAYAVGAEILGVHTLEVIAFGAPDDCRRLAVALDAQRGELAVGEFERRDGGRFVWARPMRLVEAETWLESLPEGMCLTGPVFEKLDKRTPGRWKLLPAEYGRPTAANVARLAAQDYAEGRRDDLWKLAPLYSRRSAAEEKASPAGGI